MCVAWTLTSMLEGNATLVLHTVVASSLKEVEEEVEQVKGLSVEQLLGKHTRAWEKVWIEGRVEVDSSDLELSSTIIGSQFYLLSSLPSTSEVNCGMSPGSLAKGGPMADYEGHSFWDSEVNFPTSNGRDPPPTKKLFCLNLIYWKVMGPQGPGCAAPRGLGCATPLEVGRAAPRGPRCVAP